MISVLIPSRSRPEQAYRGLMSLLGNAKGSVEVLFYLNNDDPMLRDYSPEIRGNHAIIGPDGPTSYSWNILAEHAKGDILMMGGDDSVMLTEGWDNKIEDAVDEDRISLISFDDGRPELGYPNWAITREWYETLGYFCYPELIHFYPDTWQTSIAQSIDRLHYLPDVVYEHLHFKVGKAEKDDIYRRVRGNSGIHKHDTEIFNGNNLRRTLDARNLQEKIIV